MAQETVESLKRVIRRDIKHFLISQKRRSEYTNVFTRLYHILRENTLFRSYQSRCADRTVIVVA